MSFVDTSLDMSTISNIDLNLPSEFFSEFFQGLHGFSYIDAARLINEMHQRGTHTAMAVCIHASKNVRSNVNKYGAGMFNQFSELVVTGRTDVADNNNFSAINSLGDLMYVIAARSNDQEVASFASGIISSHGSVFLGQRATVKSGQSDKPTIATVTEERIKNTVVDRETVLAMVNPAARQTVVGVFKSILANQGN